MCISSKVRFVLAATGPPALPRIIVALALGLAASQVSAVTLTWTLEGVTFNDGGTATGSFVYDSDSYAVVDWSITVSPWTFAVPDALAGPDEYTTPAFTYSTLNGSFSAAYRTLDRMRIDWYEPGQAYPGDVTPGMYPWRQLLVGFEEFLDGPRTVALDVVDVFFGECWNCIPYRSLTAGVVVAVPEPSAWLSLAVGLAAVGGLVSRRVTRFA